MGSRELEFAVAAVTGETRREIRRRGFQPLVLDRDPHADDTLTTVGVVDWDALQAERVVLFP